jgi:hypothetical protein
MASFVLNMIGSSLHSLAGLVLGSIGWGGIAALVAGLLLLLSLSARTLKFFSSPRGMAATAAVMLAGLAWMWWMWGSKPVVASDPTPIAYQPPINEPQHAFTEPRPKAETMPVGAMVVQPDRAMVPASVTPLLPLVPVVPVAGAVAVVRPSLPMPTTVRLPPIIVPLPRHTPPHSQAADTSTHTVTTQRGAEPAASPAGNAAAPAGVAQASPAPAKNSRTPGGQASMAQQARQARAMAIRRSNQALMNSPAFNPWTMSPGSMGGGRGMATMGGMNHRGGGYR